MNLKIISSSSKGNCYILENEKEALLLECGVKFSEIKKAINFNISKIVGCVITHEHQDHCKSIWDVLNAGISVFATEGTHEACDTIRHHRSGIFGKNREIIYLGGFKIMSFDVKHDAKEPCGFLINHRETGNILFITDTFYSSYIFKNLNNILIEANYSHKIMSEQLEKGNLPKFLNDRILKSHMSLENCIKSLKANDLRAVNNIVLIHLSDSNSDENYFLNQVKKATGKNVIVANKGLKIEFNKTPF